MRLAFFVRGLIIGFSLAAPVGPIGLLCIRRSLADGRVVGLATGLGAATADASYGAVAAFGLTVISGFLVSHKFLLGVLGGAFLCYLGLRAFMSDTTDHAATAAGDGLLSSYASTFALTLTNPVTILSFIPVFAGLGLGVSSDYVSASATVLGVFTGSALWWLLLSNGVASFRESIDGRWMRVVNYISGTMIFAFGLYAVVNAFRR